VGHDELIKGVQIPRLSGLHEGKIGGFAWWKFGHDGPGERTESTGTN
jgi:hypothetical protein